MRSILLIITFLCLIAAACKEKSQVPVSVEDQKITIEPGAYHTSDLKYMVSPVMYVGQNKDITDQKIINDFLARNHVSDMFSSSYSEINNNSVTIDFSSPVTFNYSTFSYENSVITISSNTGVRKAVINGVRTLKAESGLDLFFMDPYTGLRDSSTTIQLKRIDGDSLPYFTYPQNSSLHTIDYYRGLEAYVLSCPKVDGQTPPVDVTTYYDRCYKIPQVPVLYTNGKLKLPLFSSVLYTKKDAALYKIKDEWNYFFANKRSAPNAWLSEGDTLVVQNKTLFLNK